MRVSAIKAGVGIGADGDGHAMWGWASSVRLFLSRWLGIGNWFRFDEACVRCGATGYDTDYMFERRGPFRVRCTDRGVCDDARREYGTEDTDG